ncbi:hypothetical protein QFC21_002975 [Naganishia friedmannii]|uniref:Uncharacterized protein n=1 Tax=Naganishia friedmannii TaxID=89922 RepID=A0ACC2VU34_9TREE|nr:hypothetical protein QFC21_002975 [Naganishia friedmannii]
MEAHSTNAQASVNILPYLLLLPLAYLIYGILFPTIRKDFSKPPSSHTNSYNFLPTQHPSCALYQQYTPNELSVFDGKGLDEHRKPVKILLAIEKRSRTRGDDGVITEVREERTVFDVSAGRSFYGPDGPYGNFAGRDASRGMAKQSFDEGEA